MKGLLLLLALTAPTWGQEEAPEEAQVEEEPQDTGPLDLSGADLSDEALLSAWQQRRLLTARRLAEARLEQEPESIVGHFVLGFALWREEGELGRAMAHLEQADEAYLRQFPYNNPDDPRQVQENILLGMVEVAGLLGEPERQLALIDTYNELFDPDLSAERAWPLMMAERHDEAQVVAELSRDSEEAWPRSAGLNVLCALHSRAGARQLAYEACLAALVDERVSDFPNVTVDAHNAALGARAVLRFDEAETLAKEAVAAGISGVSNPWHLLLRLYLAQARGEEAVHAALETQRWRAAQPPELRDQDRASTDASVAKLLLLAGETHRGLQTIRRALDFPDRLGLSSGTNDQALATHTALLLTLRDAHRQRLLEQASAYALPRRLALRLRLWWRGLGSWDERATVRGVLSDEDRATHTLATHHDRGLGIPPWLMGDLVNIAGPGVVLAAVEQARVDPENAGFEGYYDAYAAEAELHRGDEGRALLMARRALETLPPAEVLLRARVQAIAGRAAWVRGDRPASLAHTLSAMQQDPGVLRRLELQLPARIEARAMGPVAAKANRMLKRSPRLRRTNDAFVVTVGGSDQTPRICLSSPMGDRLSCAETPSPPEGQTWSDSDTAAALVEAFHTRAFAMPLGMSRIDMDSLDGATVVAKEAARQQVQDLLGGLE